MCMHKVGQENAHKRMMVVITVEISKDQILSSKCICF